MAQEYNFKNISVADGLAQSQVYSMCEDRRGNIWFGTRGGGISRYDGVAFASYGEENGLIDNYVRAILEDRSGALWIGTDHGVSRYDGRRFASFTSRQGLFDNAVVAIAQDSSGALWFGADPGGLARLDGGRTTRFTRADGLPGINIRSLFVDRNGRVWVGTENGIAVYEKGKFTSYTSSNGLPHASISDVAQDPAGILWIATYGGGIVRFDGATFTSYTVRDGLSNNTVLTIKADETGTIWAGTGGGGVNRIRDGAITVFSETEGLCNNVIVSILKDSDGDLWFGSSGGGVSRLDGERFVHFTEKQGKLGNWIYAIYQDDDGSIWFGNSFGGVTRYDGKIYTRYSEKDHFTAGKVKCIVQDRKKRLWFGTVGNGAFVYEHGIFRHLDAADGMRGSFVNAITEDAAGDIWFACSDAGIIRYREPGTGDTARRFLNLGKTAALGWMRVYDILAGDNGELWAGTDGSGLLRVRDVTGPSPVVTVYTTRDGLSSNTIRTIARDSSGNILFGTGGGGLMMHNGSGFRIIRKQQGISSNNIYSLVVDRDKRIWLGSEKGIDRIMVDAWRVTGVKHYGKAEGITGVETTQNATCLDREGNIWFGTIQGAVRYDPRQDRPDNTPPKTHIKEIRLFFDDISTTRFADSITPWYPIPVGLDLPYDQNHLSFDFVGIGQRNPDAVRYQWKMDGLEHDWSPRSAEHAAVYSNLPPGSYTFTVRSYNEDGIGGTPEEFHFTIHPPFWGTWWFTTLAVLLAIGGIIGVFIWRLRAVRLKGERERHDIEMRRDIVELQQKSLRLSMNPHFIFNALNSIQVFITDNNPGVARRYLSRFARLMRLILENSRETNVSLAREIDMLTSYLELERLNLNNSFEYSIEIDPEIDPEEIGLPPMLVQPFVENAVIHGVRRRGSGGMIRITVAECEGLLQVSIADNGIGRGRAAEYSRGRAPDHVSSALSVTGERLAIINRQLGTAARLAISDLTDERGEPSGTRVDLYIPFVVR
ncbi:MAG: hypothetical protein JWQ98_2353 [Chlorobi bacterium]|nr:hypothetical protein [Chlorobiota bacterium]